jgi:hypothetical protein
MPPIERLFDRKKSSVRTLGGPLSFRVCRPCFRERGLIRRSFILPGITGCPEHRARLFEQCPCGRPITFVEGEDGEPICRGCGRPWQELPEDGVTAAEFRQITDLHVAYSTLLDLRPLNVRQQTLRIAREQQLAAAQGGGTPKLRANQIANLSITGLARLLVALSVDPRLVRAVLEEGSPEKGCPNATCVHFVPKADPDPLSGRKETHCSYCGCRFVGRRILCCFDLGHGGEGGRPCDATVRRSRGRLRHWGHALRVACREMIVEGVLITADAAFGRARVPKRAHLRADRLGLVDIVEDARRRQRMVLGQERLEFNSLSMGEYDLLVRFVRDYWPSRASAMTLPISLMKLAERVWQEAAEPRPSVHSNLLGPLFDSEWEDETALRLGESAARQFARELAEKFGPQAFPGFWPTSTAHEKPTARHRVEVQDRYDLIVAMELAERDIPTRQAALDYLLAHIEESPRGCPHCGSRSWIPREHGMFCPSCRRWASLFKNTLLSGVWDPRLLLARSLAVASVPSVSLAQFQMIDTSANAFGHFNRIRRAMRTAIEMEPSPTVEAALMRVSDQGQDALMVIGLGSQTHGPHVRITLLKPGAPSPRSVDDLDPSLRSFLHFADSRAPLTYRDMGDLPRMDRLRRDLDDWRFRTFGWLSPLRQPMIDDFCFHRFFPDGRVAKFAIANALVRPGSPLHVARTRTRLSDFGAAK